MGDVSSLSPSFSGMGAGPGMSGGKESWAGGSAGKKRGEERGGKRGKQKEADEKKTAKRREEAARAAMLGDEFPLRNLDLNTITVLENSSSTNNLLFHPYEPLLMVADDGNGISAFNYEESVR